MKSLTKDNGAGRLIQDRNKNIASVRTRFVGDGSTAHRPQKSNASYEKIYVGIDISKEKLNLCYQIELKTAREKEIVNDVKAIKKAFKAFAVTSEDTLICAEDTGQDILLRLLVRNLTSSSGCTTPPVSRTPWASRVVRMTPSMRPG